MPLKSSKVNFIKNESQVDSQIECKFCLNRHYNQRKTFTQLSHCEKMSVDISYCNKMKSDHLLNVKLFHQNKN